jgi:hypothetical protein
MSLPAHACSLPSGQLAVWQVATLAVCAKILSDGGSRVLPAGSSRQAFLADVVIRYCVESSSAGSQESFVLEFAVGEPSGVGLCDGRCR